MTKEAYGCIEGKGGFKLGEYVRILTVYFPFLKIFSIKNKNKNDKGNGGLIDVTSEQLNFEHKIAPGINPLMRGGNKKVTHT